MKKMHSYHLVTESPWPITASISAFSFMTSMGIFLFYKTYTPLIISLMAVSLSSIQWWRDVFRESSLEGGHSFKASKGLKMGMIFFIASEVMFFFSFFWAFLFCALGPEIMAGATWPALGIIVFSRSGIPLLNTFILLSSGASVTWSHHKIMKSDFFKTKISLVFTILLGMYFTSLQGMEYSQANFSMWDSMYSSGFFMATGFHGLHVILGSIFLIVSAAQLFSKNYSPKHKISFDAAVWYWHFVDVVWIFLFFLIYWWGSNQTGM